MSNEHLNELKQHDQLGLGMLRGGAEFGLFGAGAFQFPDSFDVHHRHRCVPNHQRVVAGGHPVDDRAEVGLLDAFAVVEGDDRGSHVFTAKCRACVVAVGEPRCRRGRRQNALPLYWLVDCHFVGISCALWMNDLQLSVLWRPLDTSLGWLTGRCSVPCERCRRWLSKAPRLREDLDGEAFRQQRRLPRRQRRCSPRRWGGPGVGSRRLRAAVDRRVAALPLDLESDAQSLRLPRKAGTVHPDRLGRSP